NKEAGKNGGRLSCGIPQVPLKRGETEYDSFRQSLPVFEREEKIVKIIKENKVALIIGETGSGKTTQIPQFLFDDCYKNGIPCRIFCTQPRHLAVTAVAERVAAERRQQVGQTVGYQIRLQSSLKKDSGCLEPWLIKEMDFCLSNIWLHKDIDSFAQMFHFILTENVSVDYRHSETSATALMIASGRGFTSEVEQLISMGASIHCKSSDGWMALDWAKHFGQTEVVDLLESYGASVEFGNLNGSSLVQTSGNGLGAGDQELLKAYQYSLDDEELDLDLIVHLIYDICNSSDEKVFGCTELCYSVKNCVDFKSQCYPEKREQIDAMDVWEDLTELGYHLAKLHVEPHLGDMVLCAVVLKCLDPVLTIACTLAYRDPFILPALASQKRAAMMCRKELAEGTFSDHMVLLRAFQVFRLQGY
ncbi:hypothetical protein ASZ78_012810, partial [Callipepla squamata]